MATHDRRVWPTAHGHPIKWRPTGPACDPAVRDGLLASEINQREVGVIANADLAFSDRAVKAGGIATTDFDETFEREATFVHVVQHQWQEGLDSGHSRGRVGIRARFFFESVRGVIGSDHGDGAVIHCSPERFAVAGFADGWIHLHERSPSFIAFRSRERQMLGRDLDGGDVLRVPKKLHLLGRRDVKDVNRSVRIAGDPEDPLRGQDRRHFIPPHGMKARIVGACDKMFPFDEPCFIFGMDRDAPAAVFENPRKVFVFGDEERAGRTAHEDLDRAAVGVRLEFGEVIDIVGGRTDEKTHIAPDAAAAAREFVREFRGGGRRGLGVGHLEDRRDSAERGGPRSRLEIFFVLEPRFPEMHLRIDGTGKNVETMCLDHAGSSLVGVGADGDDASVADRDRSLGRCGEQADSTVNREIRRTLGECGVLREWRVLRAHNGVFNTRCFGDARRMCHVDAHADERGGLHNGPAFCAPSGFLEFFRLGRQNESMDVLSLIRFVIDHNDKVIGTLAALFILASIVLLVRSISEKPEGVSGGASASVDIGAIEGAMKRVLNSQPVSVMVASSGVGAGAGGATGAADLTAVSGAEHVQVESLSAALAERESKIAALQKELEQVKVESGGGGAGAGAGAGSSASLEIQLQELQARLAEYEIIEDDIADLSLFKEENARLKSELQELKDKFATASASQKASPAELTEPIEAVAVAPVPVPASAPTPAAAPAPAAPALTESPPMVPEAVSMADDPLGGALNTDKMLAEVETLSVPETDEGDALLESLDTDKLLAEMGNMSEASGSNNNGSGNDNESANTNTNISTNGNGVDIADDRDDRKDTSPQDVAIQEKEEEDDLLAEFKEAKG